MLGERIRVVVPLVLSIASFVLAMIALFAGSSPGQMEDIYIVSLNVSNFGHDVLAKVVNETLNNVTQATPTTGGTQPSTTSGSFWNRITATIGSIIDDGQDKLEEEARELLGDLNQIANNATDKVLDELEVAQWYSLHVMTLCQGDMDRNITVNCTSKQAGFRLDLPDLADEDLDKNVTDAVKQVINEQLNRLDDGVIKSFLQQLVQKIPDIPVPENLLQYPDDVRNAVSMLNAALLALFVFFVLGAGTAGLSIIFSIVAVLSTSRILTIANILVSGLSALTLAVAAVVATVMAKKAEAINEKGQTVGITAIAGSKFMGIIWAAFAAMFLTFVFWVLPPCNGRRKSRKGQVLDREKAAAAKQSMDSGRSQTRFFGRRRR